jgi:AraC-like DNA-binding protein
MHASARDSARSVYRLGPYREFAPEADLARVVEIAWTHTVPNGPGRGAAPAHRVIPENGVSLAVRCTRAPTGRILHAELLVIGPVRTARLYAPPPGEHLEAIRLRAEWCRTLLGVDPAEHADALTPLREIDSRRAAAWRDALSCTQSPHAALFMLAAFVRDRMRAAAPDRGTRIAHEALERLRRDTRAISVIAHQLGVTDRHARRVVRDAIGIGAKQFARVHRLNAVVSAADALERPNWARLAASAGYFDQSHLITTCRALTGRSAVELHRERRLQERPDGEGRAGRAQSAA